MASAIDTIVAELEAAARDGDPKKFRELKRYFIPGKDTALPFQPALGLNPKAFDHKLTATESDAVLSIANAISRGARLISYRRKLRNYDGPIIVSEGDSWFQYPFFLEDVIDCVMDQFACLSLGAGGDLLSDIALDDEFTDAIDREGAHIFMISGGGNDMLHDERLKTYLFGYRDGMTAEEVVNHGAFSNFLNFAQHTYEELFERLVSRFPHLKILCHGYDYALPVSGGRWLGKPLAARQVPKRLWASVIEILIDELNVVLKTLQAAFPGRVFHVDCRGLVGPARSWHDELHPKNPGFKRAASRFTEQVEAIGRGVGFAERSRIRVGPIGAAARLTAVGRAESLITTGSDFDPGRPDEAIVAHPTRGRAWAGPEGLPRPAEAESDTALADEFVDPCSSLEAWRSFLSPEDHAAYRDFEELRADWDQPDTVERRRARREMIAGNDLHGFERIIGTSNIYQVSYLDRGHEAAKSVGRISIVNQHGIPMGFGTGFLVGPGLLLTNNHVIDRVSLAQESHILFDYQYDAENNLLSAQRFSLSDSIFYTSSALDFSFAHVVQTGHTGKPLSEYGYLKLIRDSGKALKKEFVSIIQHGKGLPKQIAMRDSQILGRKRHYIYYTTDTNPGSSGSPVVNDHWFPVALHHRTVPDINRPCGYVANRGIRISSIFDDLDAASMRGEIMARRVLDVLAGGTGTDVETTSRGRSMVALPRGSFDDAGRAATERLKEPFRELPYDNRYGYDPGFLGLDVPLPAVRDTSKVSKRLDNGDHVVSYEHFSLAMDKNRRLALWTAANVDASRASKRPESDRDYTRRGLSGLGRNDHEKWFKDPRLPSRDQLPDKFFTKDRAAFDKGHVVRRDAVAWGASFGELRRANGDTYHTTNCSPQVRGFNRSGDGGVWGKLENLVLKQAKTERLCVMAGPVLDPADQPFEGVDDQGPISVQIPAKYWKVIIAVDDGALESFAFLLEQDLSSVPFEFQVDADWRERMVAIDHLEVLTRNIDFPKVVKAADQFALPRGGDLREMMSGGPVDA